MIPAPENVLLGIEAVCESGLTNMLDRPVVIELARGLGFSEAVGWIENNRIGSIYLSPPQFPASFLIDSTPSYFIYCHKC